MDQELLDLAYRFRDAKLWKIIYEKELFAVQLSNRQIGYCSLMGRSGEHMALGLYIGSAGFSTYRDLISRSAGDGMDRQHPAEWLTQDCIQCSLEKRDQLSPEEIAELQKYCGARGIPCRAPYPCFARFHPYCMPWNIASKSDWNSIKTALAVLDRISGFLQTHSKKDLGLRPVEANADGERYLDADAWQMNLFSEAPTAEQNNTVTIPLFSLKKGELVMRRISLPPFAAPALPSPRRFNEIAVAKLMKLKKAGVLQCEVLRMPEPVEGDPPYLPAVLLAVELNEGMVLQPVVTKGAAYDPDVMMEGFVESLLSFGVYPQRVLVRTAETAALLRPLCEKARIELETSRELEALDEAAESLWTETGSHDYLEEVIEMLDEMSPEQIRQLPPDMLRQMLEAGDLLPVKIAEKIRKALRQ